MSLEPAPDSTGGIASRLESVTPSRYGALKAWKMGEMCALQLLWRGKAPLAPYPAAKLGDVVHRMLDRYPNGADEAQAKAAWDEALAHTEDRLKNDWVTYGLLPLQRTVRCYSLKRILTVRGVLRAVATIRQSCADGRQFAIMSEEELQSADGLLKGRADLIKRQDGAWILVDYKSGEVYEDDEENGGYRIKEEYALQLRLYAHLIREAKGIVISKALLRTLDGREHEFPVDQKSAHEAGTEARSLLTQFNSEAQRQNARNRLAKPMAARWEQSVFGCAGCLFRPLCPAYLAFEKRCQAGERWPRDAWGQVVSVERTGGNVRIQILNENRLMNSEGQALLPVVFVTLRDTPDRHPALSRLEVGADIQVFDYIAPRLGLIAQDGPRTCVYLGPRVHTEKSCG